GRRLHELLVEAGHAAPTVRVLLADLEEAPPGDLSTGAVQVVEDAEHHLRPTVAGAPIEPKIHAPPIRPPAGGAGEPLDPLETSFRVQQLHVLHRRTPSGPRPRVPCR